MHKDHSSVMGKRAHNNTQLTQLVVAASRYQLTCSEKLVTLVQSLSKASPPLTNLNLLLLVVIVVAVLNSVLSFNTNILKIHLNTGILDVLHCEVPLR